MRGPLTLSRIPLKNLRAHPVRTVILFLLTLAQAACVFSGLTMIREIRQELTAADARLGADILIYPSAAMSRISSKALLMQGTPVEVWKDRSLLKRMDDCEGIDQVACQLYIRDTTQGQSVWIVGFDPEKDFTIAPWVQAYEVKNLPEGYVIAGCKAAEESDSVILFGKTWPVAARLMETGSELDEMVFVNLNTLSQLIAAAENAGVTAYSAIKPENDFTVALVKVQNKVDLDSVTSWLNVYLRKVKAVRSEATLTDTSSGIHGQIGIIAMIAIAAWIVLLFALGIAQSMMMKERRKELYLWHAIGATHAIVDRVMLREAMLIHSAGAISGMIVAWGAFCLLGKAAFTASFALLTITLSIVVGCFSTIIAVRRATNSLNEQMLLTV